MPLNRLIQSLVYCWVFANGVTALADTEPCPIDGLMETGYTDALCQFNLGTTAYRAGAHELAAAHWRYLINSDEESERATELRAVASATYSFLQYHGLGVEQDKQTAVDAWLKATSFGEYESRNQLGNAFSDKEYDGYDPVKSLAWFKSLLLVTENADRLDESDRNIYDYAVSEVERLEEQLSKKEIEKSNLLAKKFGNLE